MRLLLVRHAIAEDGIDDDARPVSSKGRRRFKKVVGALDRLDVKLDHIVHSPKLRALQTAELMTPLLRDGGTTWVLDLLADLPGADLFQALEAFDGDVALVGHQPYLGRLLAWLVTGRPAAETAFELRKGAVAVLDGNPRPGEVTLTMLLPPKVARI
jgi:phosphohistidine phosphatase